LDREREATHRLVVQLSDGIAPYPYHTTDCVVMVIILDVNDNYPVFVSPTQFQGNIVSGKVKAVDKDEGRNAVVSYRILPESLPRAEFIIDAVSGDILVNKPLDYEKTQNYTFTVSAMDYGTPQLWTLQEVTVFVLDMNDHAPILHSRNDVLVVDEVP
uniref:CA domain-containing protein n=1 Tax=Angiostrongylus cantonensis TaxID=6313 RepID=A0A0K0DRP0_ANGCA